MQSTTKIIGLAKLRGKWCYLAAGNSIGSKVGKEKMEYKDHSGMCLETQYFPNSANERAFVTPEFGKDKKYKTTTIYRFSIEE